MNEVKVNLGEITHHILRLVPKGIAMRYCLMPIRREGWSLSVAMADPNNQMQIDDLKVQTGFTIKPIPTDRRRLIEEIRKNYELTQFEYQQMLTQHLHASEETVSYSESSPRKGESGRAGEKEPVFMPGSSSYTAEQVTTPVDETVGKVIQAILEKAIISKANEVHLERIGKAFQIRFRIENELVPDNDFTHPAPEQIFLKLHEMSGGRITEAHSWRTGTIHFSYDDRDIQFPLWWFRTIEGERVMLKICDNEQLPKKLSELDMGKKDMQVLARALHRSRGLIICSSPPRQGKTVTMLTILQSVKAQDKLFAIIGNTMEYLLPGFYYFSPEYNQLTYPKAANLLITGGCDVLSIEDISNHQRALAAISSSRSVLTTATMNAFDCVGAFLGIPVCSNTFYSFCESDITIVCQRLFRMLCPFCKTAVENKQELAQKLSVDAKTIDTATIYKATGCERCNRTGYKGRKAIFQTLTVTDKLKDLRADRAKLSEIKAAAKETGMVSLRELALPLVFAGLTSVEEIFWSTFKL